MKQCVDDFISYIKEHPSKFTSSGNSEFSGFHSDEYKLYFAGNDVFYGYLSIISLSVNDTKIELSMKEKHELEKISKWWWYRVPASQI